MRTNKLTSRCRVGKMDESKKYQMKFLCQKRSLWRYVTLLLFVCVRLLATCICLRRRVGETMSADGSAPFLLLRFVVFRRVLATLSAVSDCPSVEPSVGNALVGITENCMDSLKIIIGRESVPNLQLDYFC